MNALVEAVRDAAVTDLTVSERVARQELVAPATTGYKAPRVTRLAGMYAAAAIRAQLERVDVEERTVWDVVILEHLTPDVITGWDLDERLYAALALRATFKDLREPDVEHTATIRRLASWLLQTSGPELPRVTARLCQHVLDTGAHTVALPALWSAVHEPRRRESTVPGDGAP
ncbi:hypothetical protein H9623_18475 [Oerskovia sp. Sa1BUA8]|uniref:Uncharacterized protein n=1 Tax=Oerskovia douganii TaxID=2762210 RepID=A0A9D5Z196_9CELL|nr:hypothetical protein [Oerskovia douganii]MBE7702281.1 hypothetical protein [Oerskovia douganii]